MLLYRSHGIPSMNKSSHHLGEPAQPRLANCIMLFRQCTLSDNNMTQANNRLLYFVQFSFTGQWA